MTDQLPISLPEEASAKAVDFIARLLGPVGELADWGGDKVRFWRFRSALKTIERASELAQEHGIRPEKIPLKYLVPFIEKASLEEDDDLINAWASLLASASREFSREDHAFAEVLARLTRDEVVLLDGLAKRCSGEYDAIIEHASSGRVRNTIVHYFKEHSTQAADDDEIIDYFDDILSEDPVAITYLANGETTDLSFGRAFEELEDIKALDGVVGLLKHLGLVSEEFYYHYPDDPDANVAFVIAWITLTTFGWRFVQRCSLKPAAEGDNPPQE